MSITQTYYLAHKARAKLSREAAQSDHDLRLLVGHANLLDTLMLELADAEREQERWFNQSVRTSEKPQERHVQWADNIAEVPEEDEEEDDYDSDSSDDDYIEEDDVVMSNMAPLRPVPSKPGAAAAPIRVQTTPVDDDDDEVMEDDLEEDYAQLELVRTHSHSNSPPELVDETDSSDDESMPPSPPTAILSMPKGKEGESEQESLYEEDYYSMPRQTTPTTGMVSAISVY